MTLPLDRRIGHHRDEEPHEEYGGLQRHRRFDRHRRIGQYETGEAACPVRIATETAGPFPGERSMGPNVLQVTGVVRNDIRTSFGTLSGTAAGIPITIALTLVSATSCAPLANRAVYVWHCDRAGLYSLFSAGATNQNDRRGVAATDANGQVSFTPFFPACYPERWPHIHFKVFTSLATATNVANKLAPSQIALPKATCDRVDATTGYSQSISFQSFADRPRH